MLLLSSLLRAPPEGRACPRHPSSISRGDPDLPEPALKIVRYHPEDGLLKLPIFPGKLARPWPGPPGRPRAVPDISGARTGCTTLVQFYAETVDAVQVLCQALVCTLNVRTIFNLKNVFCCLCRR